MGADKYPSAITTGEQKRKYDVFARLAVIDHWPGYGDMQQEHKEWLRAWLKENTTLSDDQLASAKPVKYCDLPQGGSWDKEKAFIAEREVWWIYDDLGGEMQSMKSENRDWLENKRKQIWNNAEGNNPDAEPGWNIDNRKQRYDNLAVATKHGSTYDDWKKTHNAETGEPKDGGGWRDKSAKWHDGHLGMTEQPPDSNCDNRDDGIRASQDKCANGTWLRYQPWCGVWAFRGLLAGDRVEVGASWLASVASIEDYAKQGKGPFKGWTTDGSKAKKGDLVVLFGRGQHVGTVRSVDSTHCHTWEGNTSSGSGGSQSNGGGSYKRSRSRSSETYGYALVADPA